MSEHRYVTLKSALRPLRRLGVEPVAMSAEGLSADLFEKWLRRDRVEARQLFREFALELAEKLQKQSFKTTAPRSDCERSIVSDELRVNLSRDEVWIQGSCTLKFDSAEWASEWFESLF